MYTKEAFVKQVFKTKNLRTNFDQLNTNGVCGTIRNYFILRTINENVISVFCIVIRKKI